MDKSKEQIEMELRQQIWWIALRGCSIIKCKNCCLKNVCTHNPKESSAIAMAVIRSKEEADA